VSARPEPERSVSLDVQGMTCASCVARIEKVLLRQDGVVGATVNLATNMAMVRTTLPDDAPLIAAIERAGYGARAARERGPAPETMWSPRRLLVAGCLTYAILCLTFALPAGRAALIASWILATPVQFYSGWPFLRSAWTAARHRTATMDTLIAVGSLAAYLYSTWSLIEGRTDAYFDTGAVIVTLVLLGKHLESGVRRRAGDATRALLERGAKVATVVRDGSELTVPIEELLVGDVVVVLPGEKVPADGVVRGGASWVDLSMLTGESTPVDVSPGSPVVGASINGRGRLVVEITGVGSETKLAEIVRVLTAAQGSKPPIQRLADRISAVFVPRILVLAAAVVLFGALLLPGGLHAALLRATAVLLVACPCALGLATPAAIMAGSGRAAELGILFKGGEVFEAAKRIDTVLLDKTGTITEGRMAVVEVVSTAARSSDEVVALAAAAERGSEHPIATAIVDHAAARAIPFLDADGFEVAPGAGARASVGGREVLVGRPAELGTDLATPAADLASRGLTVVAVWEQGRPIGVIGVSDRLKASTPDAVRRMTSFGLEVRMVTGDRRETADALAAEAGIADVAAEVFPEGKVQEVKRLQAAGKRVAFVGDGINDAPALAQADLGIALGTGTDVAIEAADVMVLGGDPAAAADALVLARRTYWVISQNLAWAFAYNALMIPLAIVGRLTPVAAASAMALSSVTVVANALRLRMFARRSDAAATGPFATETPGELLARLGAVGATTGAGPVPGRAA
jgi:heavy metal translocating P-type ATPase